jgi:non-reducing end alpha-L-arabinofuranosidase
MAAAVLAGLEALSLDATNCGKAKGTVADQWIGLGNACQQWNIAP